ncbi:MAG: formate dehydrogenase subunit gamma [Proteobacteria bacterium]|nr:formate dehydrogenase subunit gamma [Pseudomonadota bacterium]MDA1331921.1 formate dehydrogenase subunit gamma [Pseudomonadota bacterium]
MGNTDHKAVISAALEKHASTNGALLPILHEIQDVLGYIPTDAIDVIGKSINRSRAEVHGVVSFYHHFRTQKPGRHIIQVCRSEACQAVGSEKIIDKLKLSLGIDFHESTLDGQITLEPIYCLGHCACAPALMVNGEPRAKMTSDQVESLLNELRATNHDD